MGSAVARTHTLDEDQMGKHEQSGTGSGSGSATAFLFGNSANGSGSGNRNQNEDIGRRNLDVRMNDDDGRNATIAKATE
jgi:hypothetical protein